MDRVQEIISLFGLKKHPEGGYYRRTYVSSEIIAGSALPLRFKGERSLSSSIYYLVTSDDFSAFHRINQDEIWHYYEGSSVSIHIIEPAGNYYKLLIGKDYGEGQEPQAVIPAGCYFAASVNEPASYCFVGCTLSPAFDYSDLDITKREEMLIRFPQHQRIIMSYTRV